MTPHRTRAILALIVTMLIWGTSAVFIRTTALALSAENALALRYLVLVAMIVPGLALTGGWRIAQADWGRMALPAMAMLLSASTTSYGLERVAAGVGSLMALSEPIIIAVLFRLFFAEPLSPRIWAGVAVACLGAGVLFWPDITAAVAQPVDPAGLAFLLAGSLGFSLFAVAAKPLLARYSGFTVTGWAMLLAAPAVLALASDPLLEIVRRVSLRTWAETVYLAGVSSLGGAVLWNYGVRHLPGAVAGASLYLLPVVGVAAGALLLGEPVTGWIVTGGLLMLAGVAVAQSRG